MTTRSPCITVPSEDLDSAIQAAMHSAADAALPCRRTRARTHTHAHTCNRNPDSQDTTVMIQSKTCHLSPKTTLCNLSGALSFSHFRIWGAQTDFCCWIQTIFVCWLCFCNVIFYFKPLVNEASSMTSPHIFISIMHSLKAALRHDSPWSTSGLALGHLFLIH